MNNLSKCLVLTMIALASPARAADSTPHDWNGFYAGIEGGGDFGTSRKNFGDGRSTGSFDTDGATGGITAGYNKQFQNIVVGFEGDISASNVEGDTSHPNPAFNYYTKNDWMGTVRPRVGYAFGSVLPFVTGGLAVGDVNVKSGLKTTGGNGVDFTKTEPGWTVGSGIEAGLSAHWTAKAEYLYTQLEDANGASDMGAPTSTHFKENTVRLGLNYKF